MQNRLTKILKQARLEPESDLALSVWQKIAAREKRGSQIRIWSFSFLGFFSIVGLIPAISELLSDLSHSGFYDYFSLIFSSSGSLFAYWRELALSLAESLPIMSIFFTLSLLFVCFLSLRFLIKQIDRNQLMSSRILSI